MLSLSSCLSLPSIPPSLPPLPEHGRDGFIEAGDGGEVALVCNQVVKDWVGGRKEGREGGREGGVGKI